MKKLWLLFILLLATVTQATSLLPNLIEVKIPEETKVDSKPIYYPIYSGGIVIDSSEVILLDDQRVSKSVYAAFKTMVDSAAKDSIFLHINSAYRTFEEQLLLRINNVKRKRMKNDTLFLLISESKEFHPVTAKPGHSSHNRGTAFDISTTEKKVFVWLKENAIKYGFVRTVRSEKWHWEYLPETTDQYQYVKAKHRSWRT